MMTFGESLSTFSKAKTEPESSCYNFEGSHWFIKEGFKST